MKNLLGQPAPHDGTTYPVPGVGCHK